jgi:hypothetical protein
MQHGTADPPARRPPQMTSRDVPLQPCLVAAFVGLVLLIAGQAVVYDAVMSSNFAGALNPTKRLLDPKWMSTTHQRGGYYGSYRYTSTSSDLVDQGAYSGISYAYFYNNVDDLVIGFGWWIVAFQLFGIVFASAQQTLASLSMLTVLTATTFNFTRDVLSGYFFVKMLTVDESRAGFTPTTMSKTLDKAGAGLGVCFAGCLIVDVANVAIINALSHALTPKSAAVLHNNAPAVGGIGMQPRVMMGPTVV